MESPSLPLSILDITDRLQQFVDARFRFDPDPHEYWLGERQLTPFSTWIKQFVEPFDEPRAAADYAAKNGLTTEAVLALWERNRWVGTQTHAAIERFYRDLPPCPAEEQFDPEVAERYTQFVSIHYARLRELQPIGLELPVWHEALGICGTIDCAAIHPSNGQVYLLDWKTNGTFSTNARCFRKFMRGPFADVLDNKENQYSMQLSFYRLILEAAGIPTAGAAMVHLPPLKQAPTIYPALDFRARIRALL